MPERSKETGRSSARNFLPAAFPNGYYDAESLEELYELDEELRTTLTQAGCREVIYDPEASAYTQDPSQTPRTEPVLLHRWKGILHGDVPFQLGTRRRDFDTQGLRVVVRGQGEIQNLIREVMGGEDVEPTARLGENPETQTLLFDFGVRQKGRESWKEFLPN